MATPAELVIEHDIPQNRFCTDVEGHQASLDYQLDGRQMVISHTGVPAAIGGKGIAAALTVAALDYARAHSLAVVPACEYVATFIRRHDEYADLVE